MYLSSRIQASSKFIRSTSSSTASTTLENLTIHKKSSANPIIAAVVVSVVVLAILAILLWFFYRRRKQRYTKTNSRDGYEYQKTFDSSITTPEQERLRGPGQDMVAHFGGSSSYSSLRQTIAIQTPVQKLEPIRSKFALPLQSSKQAERHTSYPPLQRPRDLGETSRDMIVTPKEDKPVPDPEKTKIVPPPMEAHPAYQTPSCSPEPQSYVNGTGASAPAPPPAPMTSPSMRDHPTYHLSRISQHPAFRPQQSPPFEKTFDGVSTLPSQSSNPRQLTRYRTFPRRASEVRSYIPRSIRVYGSRESLSKVPPPHSMSPIITSPVFTGSPPMTCPLAGHSEREGDNPASAVDAKDYLTPDSPFDEEPGTSVSTINPFKYDVPSSYNSQSRFHNPSQQTNQTSRQQRPAPDFNAGRYQQDTFELNSKVYNANHGESHSSVKQNTINRLNTKISTYSIPIGLGFTTSFYQPETPDSAQAEFPASLTTPSTATGKTPISPILPPTERQQYHDHFKHSARPTSRPAAPPSPSTAPVTASSAKTDTTQASSPDEDVAGHDNDRTAFLDFAAAKQGYRLSALSGLKAHVIDIHSHSPSRINSPASSLHVKSGSVHQTREGNQYRASLAARNASRTSLSSEIFETVESPIEERKQQLAPHHHPDTAIKSQRLVEKGLKQEGERSSQAATMTTTPSIYDEPRTKQQALGFSSSSSSSSYTPCAAAKAFTRAQEIGRLEDYYYLLNTTTTTTTTAAAAAAVPAMGSLGARRDFADEPLTPEAGTGTGDSFATSIGVRESWAMR